MCTTYPDRPRGAGPGETDATPAAAEGDGRATRITHHTSPAWRVQAGPQGLAGLLTDAPSEARGADGERAGGPDGARNTGGTASRNPSNAAIKNTGAAASKNTGGTKKPGGASAPPSLYARLTFP